MDDHNATLKKQKIMCGIIEKLKYCGENGDIRLHSIFGFGFSLFGFTSLVAWKGIILALLGVVLGIFPSLAADHDYKVPTSYITIAVSFGWLINHYISST